MTRVAINGLGRIGRAFFKLAYNNPAFEIVAVNDLGDPENLAYLLKYDTAYGQSDFSVAVETDRLIINGKEVRFISERDPSKLPWKDMEIDIVVEATGIFASYEKSKVHLAAGAKRVVITAPVKDDPNTAGVRGATILMGVNEKTLDTCEISSNGSCTTNASSPLVAVLDDKIGIEKAVLNTVHAYTSTQAIVDRPNQKDFRKGRSAAQNIIPTSTGAAIAVTKAYEPLEGKFDGIALRVPVVVGSIADVTFIAKKETSVEEINSVLTEAASNDRWKNILAVTNDPIVSADIIGAQHAAIADLSMTRVVGGNLVKVLAWYDNEMGYTAMLVKHVQTASASLSKDT